MPEDREEIDTVIEESKVARERAEKAIREMTRIGEEGNLSRTADDDRRAADDKRRGADDDRRTADDDRRAADDHRRLQSPATKD